MPYTILLCDIMEVPQIPSQTLRLLLKGMKGRKSAGPDGIQACTFAKTTTQRLWFYSSDISSLLQTELFPHDMAGSNNNIFTKTTQRPHTTFQLLTTLWPPWPHGKVIGETHTPLLGSTHRSTRYHSSHTSPQKALNHHAAMSGRFTHSQRFDK